VVQISASGSFYVCRYTQWNIGFFTSYVISLKHLLWVKNHNLFIEDTNSVRPIALEIVHFVVFFL
jgi:hypothetical protein